MKAKRKLSHITLICTYHPQTLGLLLGQVSKLHVVEPQHLRLSRDEGPESRRSSGLTRPVDILLYGWRGDHHYFVDLVCVSPAQGGWRDAASTLATVEQAKRDKHMQTCASHRLDFLSFGFSVLDSFGRATQELLDRVCRRYRIHARVVQWEAHAWIHRRLSFAVMRRVAINL